MISPTDTDPDPLVDAFADDTKTPLPPIAWDAGTIRICMRDLTWRDRLYEFLGTGAFEDAAVKYIKANSKRISKVAARPAFHTPTGGRRAEDARSQYGYLALMENGEVLALFQYRADLKFPDRGIAIVGWREIVRGSKSDVALDEALDTLGSAAWPR